MRDNDHGQFWLANGSTSSSRRTASRLKAKHLLTILRKGPKR